MKPLVAIAWLVCLVSACLPASAFVPESDRSYLLSVNQILLRRDEAINNILDVGMPATPIASNQTRFSAGLMQLRECVARIRALQSSDRFAKVQALLSEMSGHDEAYANLMERNRSATDLAAAAAASATATSEFRQASDIETQVKSLFRDMGYLVGVMETPAAIPPGNR